MSRVHSLKEDSKELRPCACALDITEVIDGYQAIWEFDGAQW